MAEPLGRREHGDYDTLIAAHAMELRLTLVTNNVKHFNRVTGLKLDNRK
jgi:tRNA(fMet)-specific endonuclease VapC